MSMAMPDSVRDRFHNIMQSMGTDLATVGIIACYTSGPVVGRSPGMQKTGVRFPARSNFL